MKFQEKNPNNARIFIDYDAPKEHRVKFEYPLKRSIIDVCFPTFMSLGFKFVLFVIAPITLIASILLAVLSENFIYLIYIVIAPLLLLTIVIPIAFALSLYAKKNNSFLRRMPGLNKFNSLFPFGEYNYKKIIKLDKKEFEIPIFDNVFLTYKATKDFGEYLQKIEITEHEFHCVSKIFGFFNISKEYNNYDWKARFIFSKIPKKGYLEIEWL